MQPSKILRGGHRGMGCTDHAFYTPHRDLQALPSENTLQSFISAYRAGAAYVELDAVVLGDEAVVCIHNVVPSDHYFDAEKPGKLLNQLTHAELSAFAPGRAGSRQLCSLDDALAAAHQLAPKGGCPWKVNIELKGAQGSGQSSDVDVLVAKVFDCVMRSPLAPHDILFSSFCLESVMQMAHRLPRAHYGMLFNETAEVLPIYADQQDLVTHQYLPFTLDGVATVLYEFDRRFGEDGPQHLGYLHPEFESCTTEMCHLARVVKRGVNVWSYMEAPSEQRMRGHVRLARLFRELKVPYTVITDYLDQLGQLEF